MLSCIALKVDWTGNPPQPISTGNTHALYHLLRLQDLVLWFVSLVGLLASLFQWDNKLYQDDHLALLGPNYNVRRGDDVWKNRSRNPKSACISQKVAESRMGFFFQVFLDWCPWLITLSHKVDESSFVPSLVYLQALKILVHASVCVCPVLKRHCKMTRHVLECLFFAQSLQLIPSVRPNL